MVRLDVSIATAGDFREHPKVADAASEMLVHVFGEEKISTFPCHIDNLDRLEAIQKMCGGILQRRNEASPCSFVGTAALQSPPLKCKVSSAALQTHHCCTANLTVTHEQSHALDFYGCSDAHRQALSRASECALELRSLQTGVSILARRVLHLSDPKES